MPWIQKITNLPKALQQLGANTIWLYAKYQFTLRSGLLRILTPGSWKAKPVDLEPRVLLQPSDPKDLGAILGFREKEILDQANELIQGKVLLFGAEARQLDLRPPSPLKHWTRYHSQMPDGSDIKPVWETGRFSWAPLLARAYWLSAIEDFAEGFWNYFEEFIEAHPANFGPHWSSAQEVALRLISFAYCYSLLAKSTVTTSARKQKFAASVVEHAERIPPTIDYARAQNNNHQPSEAIGLVTAAALLPEYPKAEKWKKLGWKLFNEGINRQIHADGSYVQHSSNYHRLVLQLGLWANVVERVTGDALEENVKKKLAAGTEWLVKLLDEESGRVPNLGPNDGAYILPLSVLPFEDYRPTLQAASMAFREQPALQSGIWDEMALWLGIKSRTIIKSKEPKDAPLRLTGKNTWAFFRATHFQERPGHADQLHLDIWWRGLNVAQDGGSYLYTAPAPWDNALASARVHNTVTINDQEPMTRAGRFLWLDWAQAKIISTTRDKKGNTSAAAAQHDGYTNLGVTHRREVSWNIDRWVITDRLLPVKESKKDFHTKLHWLLPDWDWQIDTQEIRIESPHGEIQIAVDVSVGDLVELRLFREGKLIHGSGQDEAILGWASQTYGVKQAALSFVVDATGPLPITMTSTWTFSDR